MLELRNPHSVLATFKRRPKAVRSIRLNARQSGTAWDDVAAVAAERGVAVSYGAPTAGGRGGKDRNRNRGGRDTERVGAGSAMIEPPSPIPLGNLLKAKPPREDGFGIWLGLDQVQDPQNLGAIFRLAGFFGVCGIVMTKDKSAPINGTVCDVATGGVEHVPYSVVSNLAQAMQQAQKSEIWVIGTSEHANDSLRNVKRDRHWMLVMGNEGEGIRRLTLETCDTLASLPALGPVPSLNVAAATAACLAVLTGE
jgi:23S rRNA (guanosine2251-2'-O)-methyltransferase